MVRVARNVGLFAIWAFLMWLGLTAIDHPDYADRDAILGMYVFVASTAVATLVDWLWKQNSN